MGVWGYVLVALLVWAGIKAGPAPLLPGTGQIIAAILVTMVIVGLARV